MNSNPNLGSRGGWPADIAAKQTPADQHSAPKPLTLDRATLQAIRDAALPLWRASELRSEEELRWYGLVIACRELDTMLARAESKEKEG